MGFVKILLVTRTETQGRQAQQTRGNVAAEKPMIHRLEEEPQELRV